MTLDKMSWDEWELNCDSCSQAESFSDESFENVRMWLEEENWRTYKKDNEWQHKCPLCVEGNPSDFEDLT